MSLITRNQQNFAYSLFLLLCEVVLYCIVWFIDIKPDNSIKNIHINPIWANVHPYKQILIIIPKEKDKFYAQLKDLKILYGTNL